mmetsp:Transcript_19915/g.46737  ORF Transcript_19915/g.46737 Transcript_19915/m.46737 type:complete len:207 (-) Transcript_19915:664-1284(-)
MIRSVVERRRTQRSRAASNASKSVSVSLKKCKLQLVVPVLRARLPLCVVGLQHLLHEFHLGDLLAFLVVHLLEELLRRFVGRIVLDRALVGLDGQSLAVDLLLGVRDDIGAVLAARLDGAATDGQLNPGQRGLVVVLGVVHELVLVHRVEVGVPLDQRLECPLLEHPGVLLRLLRVFISVGDHLVYFGLRFFVIARVFLHNVQGIG